MMDCWMCLFFSLTVTLSLFPESFLVIKVAHLSSPLVSAVTRPVTGVLLWTERWLDRGQAGRERLCCTIPPTCLITLSRQGDLVNCLIWRLKYYVANVLCYGHFWVLFWIHGLRRIDFLLHLTFAWASLIFNARVYLDIRFLFHSFIKSTSYQSINILLLKKWIMLYLSKMTKNFKWCL